MPVLLMCLSIAGSEESINYLGLLDHESHSNRKLILPRTHRSCKKDSSPVEPLMGTPALADALFAMYRLPTHRNGEIIKSVVLSHQIHDHLLSSIDKECTE